MEEKVILKRLRGPVGYLQGRKRLGDQSTLLGIPVPRSLSPVQREPDLAGKHCLQSCKLVDHKGTPDRVPFKDGSHSESTDRE